MKAYRQLTLRQLAARLATIVAENDNHHEFSKRNDMPIGIEIRRSGKYSRNSWYVPAIESASNCMFTYNEKSFGCMLNIREEDIERFSHKLKRYTSKSIEEERKEEEDRKKSTERLAKIRKALNSGNMNLTPKE